MPNYYADSSVLVKRHIAEVGTVWFQTRAADEATVIITSQLTAAETYSAFNRRVREGTLTPDDYTHVAADFDQLFAGAYQTVSVTMPIIERARRLLEQHPLRAYDAVQLATALTANDALVEANLPPLTLLAADDRLLVAAQSEGLSTDNPNSHP